MSKSKKIAIAYNLKRLTKYTGLKTDDEEAEFDSVNTLQAVSKAIEALGHRALLLEANALLAHELKRHGVDLVFNLAEGRGGLHREAQVPALLELMGISYTGSDARALTITLDKG